MNILLTNENIRWIGVIVSIILGIIIMTSYHKIVVKVLVRKIEDAIEKGDKETANKLLMIAKSKGYRDKVLQGAYSNYVAKFPIED